MVACPTYYGRQNGARTPLQMLLRQRDRAVPVEKYGGDGPRSQDSYPVGVLHHVERAEYTAAYAESDRQCLRRLRTLRPCTSRSVCRALAVKASSWRRRCSATRARRPDGTSCRRRATAPKLAAAPPRRRSSSRATEIDFPEVRRPDLTLCLSQPAFDQYAHATRTGGLVVADTGLIHTDGFVSDARLAGAPFTEIATTRLGKAVATNVVALGAVLALTGVAPPEAVKRHCGDACPRRS